MGTVAVLLAVTLQDMVAAVLEAVRLVTPSLLEEVIEVMVVTKVGGHVVFSQVVV